MKFKSVYLCLALIIFISIVTITVCGAQCFNVGYVSDETGSRVCPNGYAVSGIYCSGAYCDNKTLKCCPYVNGQDHTVRGGWSNWISEEPPYNAYFNNGGWIAGIACRGAYCDSMSLNFIYTGYFRNTGQCFMRNYFSEEGGFDECPQDHFVSGLRCAGAYCDNIALYCCRGTR